MPRPRKPKTAAELLAELSQDTAYLKRMAAKRQEHSERFADVKQQIVPVVEALGERGYNVDSLDQLRNSGSEYKSAVPILMHWLAKVHSPRAKEAIVRALSVPWAREAGKALVVEFRNAPASEESGLKWAIGNALSIMASDDILDDLVDLSLDPNQGRAREMIVEALGSIRSSRSIKTLAQCLKDEQVAGHAVVALGRLRSVEALCLPEPFLDHPKQWIREAAINGIAEIKRESVGN